MIIGDYNIPDVYNVAVCLSGQPRTWRTAKENILNYFDIKIIRDKNMRVNVDYFIHTWDTNSYRDKTQPRWNNKDYPIENSNEADEIREAFNPKMMEYEHYDPMIHHNAWSGLFYSFMKSVWLKRTHELAFDMTYDMVIKARFDINYMQDGVNKYNLTNSKFYAHKLQPFVAYASGSDFKKFTNEFNQSCFDDVIFYADSPTMDLISNVYRWYTDIRTRGLQKKASGEWVDDSEFYYGPGTLLYKYMTNLNIHPNNDFGIGYYVVRKEAEEMGLHSLEDWNQIYHINNNWYETQKNNIK